MVIRMYRICHRYVSRVLHTMNSICQKRVHVIIRGLQNIYSLLRAVNLILAAIVIAALSRLQIALALCQETLIGQLRQQNACHHRCPSVELQAIDQAAMEWPGSPLTSCLVCLWKVSVSACVSSAYPRRPWAGFHMSASMEHC